MARGSRMRFEWLWGEGGWTVAIHPFRRNRNINVALSLRCILRDESPGAQYVDTSARISLF